MLITITMFSESECISYQFSDLLIIFRPFLSYLYLHV